MQLVDLPQDLPEDIPASAVVDEDKMNRLKEVYLELWGEELLAGYIALRTLEAQVEDVLGIPHLQVTFEQEEVE